MDFEAFVLNPATLLVIVFGLVEFVKQFGAKGNGLRLLSLGLGISMAVAFKMRAMATTTQNPAGKAISPYPHQCGSAATARFTRGWAQPFLRHRPEHDLTSSQVS